METTGYKIREPELWKALGIDNIEINEVEPEPIPDEHINAASQYLRGTTAQGLVDNATGALSPNSPSSMESTNRATATSEMRQA